MATLSSRKHEIRNLVGKLRPLSDAGIDYVQRIISLVEGISGEEWEGADSFESTERHFTWGTLIEHQLQTSMGQEKDLRALVVRLEELTKAVEVWRRAKRRLDLEKISRTKAFGHSSVQCVRVSLLELDVSDLEALERHQIDLGHDMGGVTRMAHAIRSKVTEIGDELNVAITIKNNDSLTHEVKGHLLAKQSRYINAFVYQIGIYCMSTSHTYSLEVPRRVFACR